MERHRWLLPPVLVRRPSRGSGFPTVLTRSMKVMQVVEANESYGLQSELRRSSTLMLCALSILVTMRLPNLECWKEWRRNSIYPLILRI